MEMEKVAKKTRLNDGEPTSRCFLHRQRSTKPPVKEDSALCGNCAAKAAALNRIKATGGDSIKAAKDAAAHAGGDICVVKMVPLKRITKTAFGGISSIKAAAEEEGKAKPVGIVRERKMATQEHIKRLLTGPPRTPLRTLPPDFFQKFPDLREPLRTAAATVLASIAQDENILEQYFRKGYAMLELEIDYGC